MKRRNKPGRPPLEPATTAVSVTFRLPPKDYDALWKRAADAKCSIAEQVRRLVTRRVHLES